MFRKKFWIDAGEAFAVAAAAVAVVDLNDLIAAPNWQQASVIGLGLARAAAVAGVRAVAPRILALKAKQDAEV